MESEEIETQSTSIAVLALKYYMLKFKPFRLTVSKIQALTHYHRMQIKYRRVYRFRFQFHL